MPLDIGHSIPLGSRGFNGGYRGRRVSPSITEAQKKCNTKKEVRMARTTSDKKGKTVILRINTELDERLKREAELEGISVSEYCRRVLNGERNTEKNEVGEKSVIQKEPEYMGYVKDATRKDIEKMCHLCGVSTEYFFDEVCRLFNEGKLEFDCMKLKSNGEYDLKYLLDICHRANVDPQEMINKLANSLVRR